MRQIVLDTETTGLDPTKGHRLTEIGCLEMIHRRLTGRRFHTYLNPEREIEKGAAAITGLTYEFLSDKRKFGEVVEDLLEFLNVPGTELIIHNAPFDLGFLNHELARLNHPSQPLENYLGVIDTLVIARRIHPGKPNNLNALCDRYKVDNSHREYHGALLDAELLARIYLAMTAGQTSMALGAEPNQNQSEVLELKLKIQKIVRNVEIPLRIIQAGEEEYRIHENRMRFIEEKNQGGEKR